MWTQRSTSLVQHEKGTVPVVSLWLVTFGLLGLGHKLNLFVALICSFWSSSPLSIYNIVTKLQKGIHCEYFTFLTFIVAKNLQFGI